MTTWGGRGDEGSGVGGRFRKQGTCVILTRVAWKKPAQHYKTIILQLKKKNYKAQSMAFVPAETLEFTSGSS